MGLGRTIGAVSFSATFWRRPECPSQLLLTLNNSKSAFVLGIFSFFQNGQSGLFANMIVNDPAIYGLNTVSLLPSSPRAVTISGVAQAFLFDNLDPSQAMTIDYTPPSIPTNLGPVVSIQIPRLHHLQRRSPLVTASLAAGSTPAKAGMATASKCCPAILC